jgi:thiol-disulfide isomerase/thioredoxin
VINLPRYKFITGITAGLLIAIASAAAEQTIQPFVKGSFAQIKSAYQGKPIILAFWSETCNYCRKELAMLSELQKQHPEMNVVTVSTDPFLEPAKVQEVFAKARITPQQSWVFADEFAEKLYADVDKRWRGELPRTYFIDAQSNMTTAIGMVKKETVEQWLATASKTAPST